ncbi:MAG: nucleotide exchange factor GrpE [Treponema sp.]|jgi:molecular chaperone GrpE (heat shock protein)|nr:nucleotide exchange factor GrpE [Treponema sp.]
MINFEAELNKLLSLETGRLPEYEFTELAAAGRDLLAELNKKQTDTSLQIEEIYDLVKEQGLLRETAVAEKTRADQLALAAIGLADLLEDFCAYAGQSGSEALSYQAKLLWENSGGILSSCGILRVGGEGQPLDPRFHTVKASAESPFPREQVVRVLQSGYLYKNTLIRKAAVVVSRGQEAEETAADTGAQDEGRNERKGEQGE